VQLSLAARLRINPNYRFGSGEPVTNPGAIFEHELQSVGSNYLGNLAPVKIARLQLQLSSELLFDLGRQSKVFSARIKGTNFDKQRGKLLGKGAAAARDHLATEESGEDAIFFRHVMADRKARALFAADADFVLLDQLADVFETHRRLVQRNVVGLGQSVDQVRGGDGLGHAVFPAARFHQVIE